MPEELNIENMMLMDLRRIITEMLLNYKNDRFGLTTSAFGGIKVEEAKRLYRFLLDPPYPRPTERPECPLKRVYKINYFYKKAMDEYIDFGFENIASIPESLFEAIANYLDSKSHK